MDNAFRTAKQRHSNPYDGKELKPNGANGKVSRIENKEKQDASGNISLKQRGFEVSAQEYFGATIRIAWSAVGVVVSLGMIFFGINFSHTALGLIMGGIGAMAFYTWFASILISCLEVASVTLLGNKDRALAIKSSNKTEYHIILYLTYALFVFDVVTNWTGMGDFALKLIKTADKEAHLSILALFMIGVFGIFTAVSELIAGWMFRALAVNFIAWKYARTKYAAYKKKLEKDTAEMVDRELSLIQS